MTHWSRWLILVGLLFAGTAWAQDEFGPYGPKPTGEPEAKKRYEANLTAHKGNVDMLVLPGLLANRTNHMVEVLAECTGLSAGGLAEFLLVDKGSSHGYEALLWSFAKPSDVHRALEFIGLKPGPPYNPAVPRVWSNGDRVSVMVRSEDGDEFPIEHLIVDQESEEPLEAEGFVFAGSITAPPRQGQTEPQYVADVYDPRSVASIYNEPAAVLDVPRMANKGDLYGSQVVNPEFAARSGELLTVVMRPGEPGKRARELVLKIDAGTAPDPVDCQLSEKKGLVLHTEPSLSKILERLVGMNKEGQTVVLDLAFGDALPIAQVSKTCTLMAMMETKGILRIQPPPTGELYYRAFLPNEQWREPAGRPTQPWELRLTRKEGKAAGQLVLNEIGGKDEEGETKFTRRVVALEAPTDVRKQLDADIKARLVAGTPPLPAVLLVFVEPGLTFADVRSFVAPAQTTHGTVYVFVMRPELG